MPSSEKILKFRFKKRKGYPWVLWLYVDNKLQNGYWIYGSKKYQWAYTNCQKSNVSETLPLSHIKMLLV